MSLLLTLCGVREMFMKRNVMIKLRSFGATLLFLVVVLNTAACDDLKQSAENESVAALIVNGREKPAYQCDARGALLSCEFLSDDLAGSGKWHHSIIVISRTGKVNLKIDGESFFQTSINNGFDHGDTFSTYMFKAEDGTVGEVTLNNSNAKNNIILNAWAPGGRKILATSSR